LPRSRRVVEESLLDKGFVQQEGDHHYFVYRTKDGLKTRARTKTSHSPKVRDISDALLSQMAKQCLITKPDFLRLVDCPMTQDACEQKLADLGEIGSS